ncbi:hypothetical protein [Maritalea sp.]|uniref:hypothetical protein n=1 Tax=Maritalea sp. TaxID=2003361 RepID=UPI003EF99551
MPTFLMKSCAPEYNICNYKTLQLGSLEYYRKHSDTEIGDTREGKHTISYNIPKSAADIRLLNQIDPYSFNFSKKVNGGFGKKARGFVNRAHTGNTCISIDKTSTNHLDATVSGLFNYTGTDALIFCCSMVCTLDQRPKMKCDDNWFMRFNDADAFALQLETSLNKDYACWAQEELAQLIPDFTADGYKTPEPKFKVFHGPVHYDGSSIHFTSFADISIENLASRYVTPELHKGRKYIHQDEYRFVALLQYELKLSDGSIEHRAVAFNRERTWLPSEDFRPWAISK